MVIPRSFSSGALSILSKSTTAEPKNFGADASQSCGQSGFTVVNVTDGANVDVRKGTIKFFFSHDSEPLA